MPMLNLKHTLCPLCMRWAPVAIYRASSEDDVGFMECRLCGGEMLLDPFLGKFLPYNLRRGNCE